MTNYFLKEMTVAIPEKAIIRNEKRVEYELERTYSSDTKDSRVVRRMIGKVDPVSPGRMFPRAFRKETLAHRTQQRPLKRTVFFSGCVIE